MAQRAQAAPTLTDLLRRSLRDADSLLRIERETGIQRASMQRFRDGRQSLRLDIADRLAAYFGIVCRQVARKD